ncbi:MAG TPA: ATP-binding protein, partial [Rhizomicrobium sp.]|nr:ATP-binding protein [Rhizomicrobium sp.]
AIALAEGARIDVEEDGLARCVQGELVYEPDISSVRFPFPNRLAAGGLRALVIAPLKFENKIFGTLLAARALPDSFSSSDCEFLLRLGTHVALAAHQAQLYTSLQHAYDDLRQSQQSVIQQERLRVLGQMASGIAHDINNAISPLSLTTQSLLETEPGMSARVRGFLEAVKRVVNDIAATVSRMREFYRPRDDQGAPRAVDLNELAQQTIELTRARWSDMPQQRGVVVQLRTVFDPTLSRAAGLESEIREALTNLIFNAVDAMPNGGSICVGTGTRSWAGGPGEGARRAIFVEVTDTGIGMDEETRRRCLEPFFTTKGERGTGLGLAMVYGAMKRQSGDIDIESALGKGTTIRLLLPEAPVTAMSAGKTEETDPLPPLKLLLIDDDPFILDSMRLVLELDGHRVSMADGGAGGLELLKAAAEAGDPFQAVFTDLGMPGMDGRAVAKAIKTVAPDMPVILLTGWGERLGGQNLSAGIDCVLAKPPEPDDLRKALLYCARGRASGN